MQERPVAAVTGSRPARGAQVWLHGRRTAVGVALAILVAGPGVGAQAAPAETPFLVGEELVFRAGSTRFGKLGTGVMSIAGPQTMGGRETYLLRFDFRGRLGIAVLEDRTRSWLDPDEMTSVRYTKRERTPLGTRSEEVEMDPARRRWEAADGKEGDCPTDVPLDELSFLYFIRTLPLKDGDAYAFDRHFDPRRNPVRVRVLGRGQTTVPAGEFQTVQVEMRVRDTGRFGGSGVIRLHLTDDVRRMPVRIESSMPYIGPVVLALQSFTPGA